MGATYNESLPTTRDWVRLLAGDRDLATPRLDDAEIDGIIASVKQQNKFLAAALACEIILTRFGPLVEKQVGDLKLKYSDDVQGAYREYIKDLRARGANDIMPAPKVFRTL
jgi:hypothetical protein